VKITWLVCMLLHPLWCFGMMEVEMLEQSLLSTAPSAIALSNVSDRNDTVIELRDDESHPDSQLLLSDIYRDEPVTKEQINQLIKALACAYDDVVDLLPDNDGCCSHLFSCTQRKIERMKRTLQDVSLADDAIPLLFDLDKKALYALLLAAMSNDTIAVLIPLLLRAGAPDTLSPHDITGKPGRMYFFNGIDTLLPLQYAVKFGKKKAFTYLLKHGSSLDSAVKGGTECLSHAIVDYLKTDYYFSGAGRQGTERHAAKQARHALLHPYVCQVLTYQPNPYLMNHKKETLVTVCNDLEIDNDEIRNTLVSYQQAYEREHTEQRNYHDKGSCLICRNNKKLIVATIIFIFLVAAPLVLERMDIDGDSILAKLVIGLLCADCLYIRYITQQNPYS